ncbi:DUF4229 domain-containing protein [Mycobacterium asiaticum]|uniref:DUF4229 domain-containing protein n=1 Tax=Mycobacterium asiaticum TaxID=1790 RepID=A0A1A3C0D0_MYCAS|nr:DUF4229 domain-containing protein [Mycobacterium asiaticum]OBI80570.1 hypothetical protein A9X01_25195 [Mycobacterium asiaticum]
MSETPSDKPTRVPSRGRGLADVLLYVAARLLLVVVITALIYGLGRLIGVADFPLTVAALGGLVISMPLGMWVFGPLRRRATATLAAAGEHRRAERDRLRARLRGETPAAEEGPAQG